MEISIVSDNKTQIIEITEEVEKAVSKSRVKDGLCNIYCPHTTAGVMINENADPSVKEDILMKLDKIVDEDSEYTHSEGNSSGHIKSVLAGVSVNVPIKGGKLILGTWQGIMFCEFDGPRSRKVVVNVI